MAGGATMMVYSQGIPRVFTTVYLLRSSALLTLSSNRHPFSCSSPPNVTLTNEINPDDTDRYNVKQWIEIAVLG